jgi:hypothetical protein
MRKRGALIAATDMIIAFLLLAIFFYFVLHFVEMKRDAQAQLITNTALKAQASSQLLTLLRTPFEDSTLGVQMTQSALRGQEVFTPERTQLITEYLDPYLDTEKQSWRLIVYGPFYTGSSDVPELAGNAALFGTPSPIQEVITGTHGPFTCIHQREEMGHVIFPLATQEGKYLKLRLDRCFS